MKIELECTDFSDLKTQLLAGAALYGAPGTVTPPPAGGGVIDPPPAADWVPDPNLPFAMPATYNAGDTIILGNAADHTLDRLEFFINGSPYTPVGKDNHVMLTVSDGKQTRPLLDTPLIVLSRTGETKAGAMNVVAYGRFPDYTVIHASILAAGGGSGIDNLCFQGASLNYAALVGNGNWTDHPEQAQVNGKSFDVFNGKDITITAPIVVVPGTGTGGIGGTTGYTAPPYTATPSVVTGATINGNPMPPATTQALCDQLPPNGVLQFPAGSYKGTLHVTVPGASVLGAGGDAEQLAGKPVTIIDCGGLQPVQNKAAILADAKGLTFKNFIVTGAAIGDDLGANAAGIRNGDTDVGTMTIENVRSTGNQNGIFMGYSFGDKNAVPPTFVPAPNLVLTNNRFDTNGVPLSSQYFGRVHNAYLNGDPDTKLVSRGNVFEKAVCGHGLKFRGGDLDSDGDTFRAGGNGAGADFPNLGNQVIKNATFELPVGLGPTFNLLTLGYENANNASVGVTCNLIDCKVVNAGNVAKIGGLNGAKLVLQDSTADNAPAYDYLTPADITGTFTKAA